MNLLKVFLRLVLIIINPVVMIMVLLTLVLQLIKTLGQCMFMIMCYYIYLCKCLSGENLNWAINTVDTNSNTIVNNTTLAEHILIKYSELWKYTDYTVVESNVVEATANNTNDHIIIANNV